MMLIAIRDILHSSTAHRVYPCREHRRRRLYQPRDLIAFLARTRWSLPCRGAQGEDALLSSMVYRIDRLANPDVVDKPGTMDSVKRMEEILVYVARFFDNYHVALRPGVVGKNLAQGLKAMNDSLRPLCEAYHIPTGFTNMICLGDAAFQRGGVGKGKRTMFWRNMISRPGPLTTWITTPGELVGRWSRGTDHRPILKPGAYRLGTWRNSSRPFTDRDTWQRGGMP